MTSKRRKQPDTLASVVAPPKRRFRTAITYVHDDRDADRWVVWLNEDTVKFLEEKEGPIDTAEHLLNIVYWCQLNRFIEAQKIVDLFAGDSDDYGDDSESDNWKRYYAPQLLPAAKAWFDANTLIHNDGLLWQSTTRKEGPFDLIYTWRSYMIR